MVSEKTKKAFIEALSGLDLVYFDITKIKWLEYKKEDWPWLELTFQMPRNSMYALVEFCKLNGIAMAYKDGKIVLMLMGGFKNHYDNYGMMKP